jgi:hypothetical protein
MSVAGGELHYNCVITCMLQSRLTPVVTIYGVTIDGVWTGEWIDRLYTPLGTTSDYRAIADQHTL